MFRTEPRVIWISDNGTSFHRAHLPPFELYSGVGASEAGPTSDMHHGHLSQKMDCARQALNHHGKMSLSEDRAGRCPRSILHDYFAQHTYDHAPSLIHTSLLGFFLRGACLVSASGTHTGAAILRPAKRQVRRSGHSRLLHL